MILKRLYLVRHGNTDGNNQSIFQPANEVLSAKGKEQAQFLAHRFDNIHLDKIVSSDMARARETAQYVALVKNMPVSHSALLQEIQRPSILVGKQRAGEEANSIFKEINEHIFDKNWHFSDEENLFDVEKRAREALSFLESFSEKEILVLTHGFFSRMLLMVMMTRDTDEAVKFFVAFRYFVLQSNTGISVVEYGETEHGDMRWRMRNWNDSAHLG